MNDDLALIDSDEYEDHFACNVMPYEKLRYTLNQVDKAGRCILAEIRTRSEYVESFAILFNWRAAHTIPNSIYMTLTRRAKKVDPRALTAQRTKRVESILRKLRRRPNNADVANAGHWRLQSNSEWNEKFK